jgi:hypothetical protein
MPRKIFCLEMNEVMGQIRILKDEKLHNPHRSPLLCSGVAMGWETSVKINEVFSGQHGMASS